MRLSGVSSFPTPQLWGFVMSVMNNGPGPGFCCFSPLVSRILKRSTKLLFLSLPGVDMVAKLFSAPNEDDCTCGLRRFSSISQAFCMCAGKP